VFFNTDGLPAARLLENEWRVIRHELQSLQEGRFAAWPERHIYDQHWSTFVLFDGYKKSEPVRIQENCALCPTTTGILSTIPGVLTAGFSRLGPGSRIRPHKGSAPTILRLHLGLVVPSDCGIRVNGSIRRWTEGRCLAFDDTYLHDAWNLSSRERVVLLVDLKYESPLRDELRTLIEPRSFLDLARAIPQQGSFIARQLGSKAVKRLRMKRFRA
jgi:aspartyl/asparaginyl beta-hydroxylase (cupin superfamily)